MDNLKVAQKAQQLFESKDEHCEPKFDDSGSDVDTPTGYWPDDSDPTCILWEGIPLLVYKFVQNLCVYLKKIAETFLIYRILIYFSYVEGIFVII